LFLLILVEPMMRLELMTPSLPRKCSTTELHRQLCVGLSVGLGMRVGVSVSVSILERKTGLEPAT
jgi:hypothetical protein